MQTHNELPVANDLLGAMPRQAYRRMQTSLESVELTYGQVLYEPMGSIRHVYFPIDCLVSLLTAVDQKRTLEVGMVGMPIALGIRVSAVRAPVQGSGTALRMTAARFRTEFKNNLPLQRALHRAGAIELILLLAAEQIRRNLAAKMPVCMAVSTTLRCSPPCLSISPLHRVNGSLRQAAQGRSLPLTRLRGLSPKRCESKTRA